MKTIKIAHLYYDLMNLYGESGNILALVNAFKAQGVKCDVDLLSKGSKINFGKYEIFYMGMGSEINQEIVRKDILRYKQEIKKIINKKTFIMTGNALELFGKSINGLESLHLFDFTSKSIRNRIVGEQVYKTYLLKEPIIGFQNRGSINNNKENHLFEVIQGNADSQNSKYEGIKINSFYGTYTIGPLLIRNPYLTNKIVEEVLTRFNYPYKELKDSPEIKAYEEYLKNFPIKNNK